MKPILSILGCGWLGLPLASHLIEKGYTVKGTTTTPEKLELLKTKGVEPYLFQLEVDSRIPAGFLDTITLIIAITSKNIDGFKTLITAIESSTIKQIIFISSTSVYPNTNGVVTEDTPVLDTPLAQIEQLFINNPNFKTTIIRFAGLFGGSRHPGNFMKPERPASNPEGYINLIHLDDCIGIITKVIQTNTYNTIFNACSDTHPTRREFYTKAVLQQGRPAPVFNENSSNSYKIVSNAKVKQLLNYNFTHSDLINYISAL
ncbi:SDR family oxidoreductase [Formosa sp. S-31]|uniref:SDR family oxidoreductase n=1 Tax=Formosa sp. S-31 TaxID=2790949 RepID=UPI003EBD6C8E